MSTKAKTLQSTKSSKTVRNVLVQPFKTKWPHVSGNDKDRIEKLLNDTQQEHLVVGLNAACEIVHREQACALLFTSDFYPQILGKQIIRMARRISPSVKILAIDNLSRNGTPEKLIAVQKCGNEDPTVSKLLETMGCISKSSGFDDDHSKISTSLKAKSTAQQKIPQGEYAEHRDQFYLSRRNSQQRMFVPNISTFLSKTSENSTNEGWGEYISFERPEQNQMKNEMDQTPVCYAPLIVNRVRGNPDRKKQIKRSSKR